MKRSAAYLGGAAVALLLVALSGWLYCLSKINFDYTVMRVNFLWLSLGALAAFGVNCVLLRRGVPVPVFAAAQVLLAGCAVFVFLHSVHLEPVKLRTMLIVGAVYTLIWPATAFAAYEAPRKNALLLCFDLSAILLATLLLLDRFLELPALAPCAGMCLVSLAAALLALVAERAERLSGNAESVAGNRGAGRLLLALCFAAVLGLAALVAAVASGGIRTAAEACAAALRWLWTQILTGLRWLYGLLERFLLWLSRFAPDLPEEAGGGPAMTGMEEAEALQEMSLYLPWWFYAALGALVLALLAWIVWKLRRHRFGRVGVRSVRRATVTRRESEASGALRELLDRWKKALRYRLNCMLLRKTAPGLLAWCERKAPKCDARRAGESGEAFLRRLAEARAAPPLAELAALVERSFYAPAPTPVSAELYRAVRRTKFT